MFPKCSLLVLLCALPLMAQSRSTLPDWVVLHEQNKQVLSVQLPQQMQAPVQSSENLMFLLLNLDAGWSPDWKTAAFDLKNLIVTAKTRGPKVKIGIRATETQIDALMNHEMAPYLDGYVYTEDPYIPEADQTGKLWQQVKVTADQVLSTLIDAGSLGTEAVLFDGLTLDAKLQSFLNLIDQTDTGSLDTQPEVEGLDQSRASFFFEPSSGNYHLGLNVPSGKETVLYFALGKGLKVSLLYPKTAKYTHNQYGRRAELRLPGDENYYFFLLEPAEKLGTMESMEIVERKSIDPYELVVKNQVFKDQENQKFSSLYVKEQQNYRYQTPAGISIDVTFDDQLVIRDGHPIERIRGNLYLGGVKWRQKKMPELPLLQPEKVQTIPLEIDLDKSYTYQYKGEDTINGHACWKVKFAPKSDGDFFSGTVWIDKETGAHRKLQAIQSGLEAPVIGNEKIVFFDWVEDNGKRYWTQVRENNMQVLTVAGLRLALQITANRSDFQFDRKDLPQIIENAYAGDAQILRDTDEGFRYLVKKNGAREVSEDTFTKKKAVLGGVFIDPSRDDAVVPLAGFNYTNFNFLNRDLQANFFIAGAVNDLVVSKPNFLGRGWDLTGELFLTAIKFSDRVFEGGEEIEDQEVQSLTESANITLGIPINSFWRFTTNYSFRYVDYSAADETSGHNEDEPEAPFYTLPQSTNEHIGRLTLEYSRKRFTSELEYEMVKRSDWEAFGFLDQGAEPVHDKFSRLQLDMSLSKRLPKFQTLDADLRFLKGWDLDRFSRFGFGFFENYVSGFGSSGAEGDQALRLRLGYQVGVGDLLNLSVRIDAARAWIKDGLPLENQEDAVNLAGIGVSANTMGPWGTLIRFNLGYGIHADLEGEGGDVAGQVVFLKLF